MAEIQPKFTVLLDRKGTSTRGLESGITLRGAPMYREGNTGVADSIQAVQEAGLLQVPSYLLVNGRIHADRESKKPMESVWTQWHNTLGERLTVAVEQGYRDIPKGTYVVDVQNAGLFMPRPDMIQAAIKESRLVNRAYPLSQAEKDLLLGERQAYQFDGITVKTVPVTLFPSYAAFLEASQNPAFLDSMPVYAVVRPVDDGRKNPSGYYPIQDQLENPDLVIAAGGKAPLRSMILNDTGEARFGWSQFGSWHDGYTTADTGRAVVLGNGDLGVGCNSDLLYHYLDGRSVGVAPEALGARHEARRAQSLDDVVRR